MKKLDFTTMGIDGEALETMNDLMEKRNRGEDIDPRQEEALRAVDLASNIIESLMTGRQVDLGYFRLYSKQLSAKVSRENQKERPQLGPLNNRKRKRAAKEAKEPDKQ